MPSVERRTDFPVARFIRTILFLTAGITSPGLLWYVAVSLTSCVSPSRSHLRYGLTSSVLLPRRISDVTAILNTNAFWAYLLSVWMASSPWQAKRLWAVLIAVFGVFVIVYGGASREPTTPGTSSSAELVGDALTLLASVLYAVYQVTYKRYVALPNRIEAEEDHSKISAAGYEPLPNGSSSPINGTLSPRLRRALSIGSEPARRTSWNDSENESQEDEENNANNAAVYPAFGLHPNFITSAIGVCTLLFVWPLVVVVHYAGIETFRLPSDIQTWASIGAVSICGVAYNVGFMVRTTLPLDGVFFCSFAGGPSFS